jgi:hypothetical protein
VFVGSDNGYIYSLDAATGCVYWSFEGGSIVRGALTVGPVTGQGAARFAVFFGDVAKIQHRFGVVFAQVLGALLGRLLVFAIDLPGALGDRG